MRIYASQKQPKIAKKQPKKGSSKKRRKTAKDGAKKVAQARKLLYAVFARCAYFRQPSSMITDTEKQAAKQTDVVFVIGQYIDIKKKGSRYIGLCPFHDERSPSFVVSPNRNQYKCFGCGASGDPIKFVMQYQGKTFPEAVKILTGGSYLDADQPVRRQQYVAPTDYFSRDAMEATKVGAYETNLFKWLKTQFSAIQIEALQRQFDIGGKGERVIFWQVDKAGRVRTGKVMAYNQETGKRSREVYPSWMHQAESFNLSQCFFGESQLMDTSRINELVCIVESEKTALIAATYWPEYIWMASGGVQNMTKGKFEALRGRDVKLYPDAKLSLDQKPTPYEQWTQLAIELNRQGFSVTVSDWIENNATPEQKESGYDLADFVTGYQLPTAAPVHLMTTAEPPTAAKERQRLSGGDKVSEGTRAVVQISVQPLKQPVKAPVHLMTTAEPPTAAKERQRLSGGDKVSEGTRAVVHICEQPLEDPVKAPVHLMTTAEQVANPADQREALQLVGEYWQQNTDTAKAEDTEASEEKWNAGKRWAEQIRQRGTTANAVPFWQRQDARQHHQQNHIKNE